MTFIVGFHCENGLAFCADSQEGDGINKRYIRKLRQCAVIRKVAPSRTAPWPKPGKDDWGYCIGAAGSSVAIDRFVDKWREQIDTSREFDYKHIETVTETLLKQAKEESTQDFDIVLGLNGGAPHFYATQLYRTYEGIPFLRPIDPGNFVCLGLDTSLANFLITSLFDSAMSVEEAMGLGILTTSLMKIHADGVGGPTTMFSYTRADNQWHGYNNENIEDWDAAFPAESLYESLMEFWKAKNPEFKDRARYPQLREKRR